jgi:hypothetical protein
MIHRSGVITSREMEAFSAPVNANGRDLAATASADIGVGADHDLACAYLRILRSDRLRR